MPDQRSYHAPDIDLDVLGEALSDWYQSQGFEVQTVAGPNDAVIVQARKEDTWRTVAGLSAALSVELAAQDDYLHVRIGAAKWADKAVVGALTALFFFPLLALPAFGAYKQKDLIDGTFRFIDRYVATGGHAPVGLGAAEPTTSARQDVATTRGFTCPRCGARLRAKAKFCDNCGAQVIATCPECGAELRAGAKFCDECGATLQKLQ